MLKRYLVILVLLLSGFSCAYSQSSEEVYYLTETELTELENIIKTQKKQLQEQTKELEALKSEVQILWLDLQTAQKDLATAQNNLNEQKKLLQMYESGERKKMISYSLLSGALGFCAGTTTLSLINK